MNILVRLPNWLGDMVMSVYFVHELKKQYPDASVSVIAKKGLEGLLQYFPPLQHQFIFSKEEYKGVAGLYKFGRQLRATQQFDVFFCLPDSFSSAFMGWATGARERVGFKNEGRSFLLTRAIEKDSRPHRSLQYLQLLQGWNGKKINEPGGLALDHLAVDKRGIVVNIHSEATSRRIPKEKAIALIDLLIQSTEEPVTLIGGPKDVSYTDEVVAGLQHHDRIKNLAGKTSLPGLVDIFSKSKAMLSSDSGPAHLASFTGLPLVVLFGAGDENETAPRYNAQAQVMRLGKLSCEPCRRNECKFGIPPPCLTDLDNDRVVDAVVQMSQR